MIICFCILMIMIMAHGSAEIAEIAGGWKVFGEGQQGNSGMSYLECAGSDPSITLGITATSSLFGPGTSSRSWMGNQKIAFDMGGFRLEAEYDGKVDSNVILTSQGSATATAFVGASASGLSTGHIPSGAGGESYDMFGWADITTEGFMYGQGTASSSASGFASYDVQKLGTPSETWGQVEGSSSMKLVSSSSNGIISTSGTTNGLHAESRVTKTMREDISASASSQLTSYASVVNKGSADVNTSGSVNAGAWDPTFVGNKVKSIEVSGTEDVASSAKGTLGTLDRRAETNEDKDTADVSSILQSTASKELAVSGELSLKSSGGPATYAATSQASSSTETFAQVWVRDALWGSLARSKNNRLALEWGKIDGVGSGAICNKTSDAVSFAKIQMLSDYTLQDGKTRATGNMTISTYAQATRNTTALGGALVSGNGAGDIVASDNLMTNGAGYTGGMNHISFVDSGRKMAGGGQGYAMTSNIATRIYAATDPRGTKGLANHSRQTPQKSRFLPGLVQKVSSTRRCERYPPYGGGASNFRFREALM